MKPNKLADESSPYLLGHAFNPVDWHPWTEEAFALADSENKPVLLSIGYSACHWCHVMEKESFLDEETARVMNDNFICIKVDREERPDIDSVYQKLGQVMGGGGGWPLTVFMTPGKAPFYIGSYFPPEGRFGLPGFKDLCARLGAFYRGSPEKAASAGKGVLSALRGIEKESSGGQAGEPAGASEVESAASYLKTMYDSGFGGFGRAPKFPCVNILEFFIMISRGDSEAGEMVLNTLRKMERGGIHDRLGGGFHRYSTDRQWRVPHFEKMLYDNALLARVYTFAHRLSPDALFKDTAVKTLSFMSREMRSAAGGFYSSIDADSGGEEGKFYQWTMDELRCVLGEDAARAAAEYLGAGDEEAYAPPAADVKDRMSKAVHSEGGEDILSSALEVLLKERGKRQAPFTDKKIIAAWNGMAVSAFARAGAVFGRSSFVETAEEAAEFAKKNLSFPDGRLRRCFKDSPGDIPGFIDDYAYMAEGLVDLYMAAFSEEYLREALRLIETAHRLFWNGAGYNYSERSISSEIIYPLSGFADGSFPSGAAVLIYNILRLGKIVDEEIFNAAAEVLCGSGGMVRGEPFGSASLARALAYHSDGGVEAVISGNADDENLQEMLAFLKKSAMPYLTVFLRTPESSIKHPGGVFEEGIPSARICGNFRCFPRASGADELKEILKRLSF